MAPEGLCGPATNVPPPELLAETQRIAELCDFSLDILRYEYPHEFTPPGKTATAYLRELTLEGLVRRYPQGTPAQRTHQGGPPDRRAVRNPPCYLRSTPDALTISPIRFVSLRRKASNSARVLPTRSMPRLFNCSPN